MRLNIETAGKPRRRYLANTRVTDEEEFEEVVVLASVHCVWGRVS